MRTTGLWATAAMLAFALAAPTDARQAVGPVTAQAPAGAAAADKGSYVLGPGDRLRIIVFGEDNMTGEYNVGTDGMVAFPLIGSVRTTDRTVEQVQDEIRTRLGSGYIKDPRVSVEVIEYRSFYILGEVNKPGEYSYRTNLTVERAVATAGGYTYRANRKRFTITHADDTQETRLEFKKAGNIRVKPGDSIQILERFF